MDNKSVQTPEEAAKFFKENAELVSSTEYNENHCEIVEAGIESIMSHYQAFDIGERRALLFCMERYLDPYYENELPHAESTVKWLEQEFYRTKSNEIKEDIFDLLQYVDVDLPGYELDDNGELILKKWWQFWK
jgi:hypothetical protein